VKTLFCREFLRLSVDVFTFLKSMFIKKLFKSKLLVSNAARSEHYTGIIKLDRIIKETVRLQYFI
jgi:hypothetical protein